LDPEVLRAFGEDGGDSVHNQHILFVEAAEPAAQSKRHLILPPPSVEPLHEVFADAMLEESFARQRRSPLDWVVSMAVHVAVLTVLLILPLYFTSGLDIQKFNLTFLSAPMTPPAAAPPAPLTSSAALRPVRNLPAHIYVPGKLTAPSFIPRAVSPAPSEGSAPEDVLVGVPGGIPGGMPGGQVGGVLGGVLKDVPAPAAPVAEEPKTPVQVGGRVKPPRLIYGPDPDYPVLAKLSRITGTVVIEAVIDERGNVTGMRAISGPPLLIPAAINAVSKRKYEPTILDGDATPIDLRVEVSFSLGT
jgi:periplasmic protein TonB